MRREHAQKMMRAYIVEAFISLLKTRRFEEITIAEIAARAGVHRSTCYRHFRGKEEMAVSFYAAVLAEGVEALPAEEPPLPVYLARIFEAFFRRREAVLRLHESGLSHLLLAAMQDFFSVEATSFSKALPLRHHMGGILGDFLLWFDNGMQPSPAAFARAAAKLCPPETRLLLLRNRRRALPK